MTTQSTRRALPLAPLAAADLLPTATRAEAGYFKFLNDRGGINGHKINFISLDDGFSPPKAVD